MVGAVCGLTGCVTYDAGQDALAQQQREDMEILRAQQRKLEGTVETLQLELQRMRAELDRARTEAAAGRSGQGQVQILQGQVEELNRKLAAESAARERDKQAIVDSISSRIAQIMKSTSPARSSSSSGGGSSAKRKVSNVGVEHVVETGQSLSAIASAYKVKAEDIIAANNLQNPNALRVGQKLFIPNGP